MALNDQRFFRYEDQWWIAEVHTAWGSGSGPNPADTSEGVLFTSASTEDMNSRIVDRIPAGFLNKLSHRSLVRLFLSAEEMDSRMQMTAYNVGHLDEPSGVVIRDDEGLRWSAEKVMAKAPRLVGSDQLEHDEKAAVLLQCLDDSALRGTLFMADASTFDDLRAAGLEAELPRLVKGNYLDYTPEDVL